MVQIPTVDGRARRPHHGRMRYLVLLALFGCGSVAPVAEVDSGAPDAAPEAAVEASAVDAGYDAPLEAAECVNADSATPCCECVGANNGTLMCNGEQKSDEASCATCGGHCPADAGAD